MKEFITNERDYLYEHECMTFKEYIFLITNSSYIKENKISYYMKNMEFVFFNCEDCYVYNEINVENSRILRKYAKCKYCLSYKGKIK